MKKVVIFTDGSCLGNPGRGGWAAVLTLPGTDARKEISGGYANTTNNRMELMGVLAALELLREPCDVTVYSDSQYVINAITKGWLKSWVRHNWIKADKTPAKNRDLWERLLPQLERHTMHYCWLKGHAGHPMNERCDELARTAAATPGLPDDPGFRQGFA